MMKRLITGMYTFLLTLTILISLVLFCTTTTPGLYLTVKATQHFLPGSIKIKGLHGELARFFGASKFVYEDNDIKIIAKDVSLDLNLKTLLNLDLKAKAFKARALIIHKKRETPPPSIPHLPFEIHLDSLKISYLKIIHDALGIKKLSKINADDIIFTSKNFGIHQLNLVMNETKATASLWLQTVKPYPIKTEVSLSSVKDNDGIQGIITINGRDTAYDLKAVIKKPAQLTLTGTFKDFNAIDATLKFSNLTFLKSSKWQIETQNGHGILKGTLDNLVFDLNTQLKSPIAGQMTTKITQKDGLLNLNNTINTANGVLKTQLSHIKDHPWQGQIDAKNINFAKDIAFHQLNLTAFLKGDTFDNLNVTSSFDAFIYAEPFKGQLQFKDKIANLTIKSPHSSLTLDGTLPYQWKLQGETQNIGTLIPPLKALKTTLKLKGELKNDHEGYLNLNIQKGMILNTNTKSAPEPFRGGKLLQGLMLKG